MRRVEANHGMRGKIPPVQISKKSVDLPPMVNESPVNESPVDESPVDRITMNFDG